jgi:hypothetical protein
MLNSYFENTYKKAKVNKFHYFAFINTYDPKNLRFHFGISLGTTLLATAALALVHPLMPALLLFDYYHLFGYAKVLNQTTFLLVLDQGKRHIYLNRLNFLGYMTKFEERRISLRDIRFMGEYTNKYVTLDNKGLLPSMSRLMNFGRTKKTTDLNTKIGGETPK